MTLSQWLAARPAGLTEPPKPGRRCAAAAASQTPGGSSRFRSRSGELAWAQEGIAILAALWRRTAAPSPDGMAGGRPSGHIRATHYAPRPGGGLVVMYTDGIFRRSESIRTGNRRLAAWQRLRAAVQPAF